MDFLNYCDQNRILPAVFPLHSTHRLQPLDVVLFKPLSTAYSTELTTHPHNSRGLLPIKKGDFFSLFWKAWECSFKKETILKSFEATGISPLNPDIILNCFNNEQQSRERSTSVLSGEDWRGTENLACSEVEDKNSTNAQRLSQAFHHIAVQNQLLTMSLRVSKSL